jgi:hypothetical protein
MEKKEAVNYLKRKNKKITKQEIDKVMKEGKIYGDPIAEIQW